MSTDNRLDSVDSVKQLLDQWTESLAQVLESMTDQKPEVHWQAATGPFSDVAAGAGAGPESEILWWEQPFHLSPGTQAWIAAPQATWEYAGTLTLKAAGLETVEQTEARNTWFEIIGQSLGVMARSIGAILGHEVTCEAGVERGPDASVQSWAVVPVQFAGTNLPPVIVALSSKLIAAVSAPAQPEPERREVPAVTQPRPDPVQQSARSRTMDLLLDVDLPVSISFGKAQLPLRDVLKLTTGSIVELKRNISEQVEVLVNQCLIARGEVVVVDGNYGVRIQEIASQQERLRSLR